MHRKRKRFSSSSFEISFYFFPEIPSERFQLLPRKIKEKVPWTETSFVNKKNIKNLLYFTKRSWNRTLTGSYSNAFFFPHHHWKGLRDSRIFIFYFISHLHHFTCFVSEQRSDKWMKDDGRKKWGISRETEGTLTFSFYFFSSFPLFFMLIALHSTIRSDKYYNKMPSHVVHVFKATKKRLSECYSMFRVSVTQAVVRNQSIQQCLF